MYDWNYTFRDECSGISPNILYSENGFLIMQVKYLLLSMYANGIVEK